MMNRRLYADARSKSLPGSRGRACVTGSLGGTGKIDRTVVRSPPGFGPPRGSRLIGCVCIDASNGLDWLARYPGVL